MNQVVGEQKQFLEKKLSDEISKFSQSRRYIESKTGKNSQIAEKTFVDKLDDIILNLLMKLLAKERHRRNWSFLEVEKKIFRERLKEFYTVNLYL